ncbi:MerR family transcriptional regulator [Streptomyces sp. NBC_01237]|uniref:MerR family transcriptional regulator n=1 Tax=Streptomyces sp. NBC_01237 TaxID=2903790 RepID=UPI002DD7D88C|nr:MerR family transcriptional regulator [Streptomyces sp. NBC_01237]WRZ72871.1 MerR family transcriptional regulator [Streptomyces sp. NBC_01237]
MDIEHLTAAQAAEHANRARQALSAGAAHITPTTIRSWVHRGHLTATGLAADNRSRTYRLADVAAAELVTRKRALRHVAAPAPTTTDGENIA